MKGLWKENLCGYDRKGNKRKKQTRHYTLKDNVQAIVHTYRNNPELVDFRYESEIQGWRDSSTAFIYGKPLPEDWWNIYGGMWQTKRRKYCQSFANRRGRRVTRDWISKADFETEIPSYMDEKSISWCVW